MTVADRILPGRRVAEEIRRRKNAEAARDRLQLQVAELTQQMGNAEQTAAGLRGDLEQSRHDRETEHAALTAAVTVAREKGCECTRLRARLALAEDARRQQEYWLAFHEGRQVDAPHDGPRAA